MITPRRALFWKTLLVVFVAALCLFEKDIPENVSPRGVHAISTATNTTSSSAIAIAATNEPVDLRKYRLSTLWGREKNPALNSFSQWTARYTNAPAAQKTEMLAEGVALAHRRRAAFKELIHTQPKLALAETVPALVRAQLPESILQLLENRVTGKGDLIVLGRMENSGDVPPLVRRAVIGDQKFDAYVYGDRAAQRTKLNVSLHGVAVDGALALSDSPLRVFEEGEPVPAEKPLAADSCPVSRQPTAPTKDGPRAGAVAAESGDHIYWMCHGSHVRAAADQVAADEAQFTFAAFLASGIRKALVIVVDFSDLSGPASPIATVDSTMNDVSSFMQKNSYGDLQISSHIITPVLRMPHPKSYYTGASGDEILLTDARTIARAAGFRSEDYDFDIVSFPYIGFGWLGQGYIGTKGVWIQGSFSGDKVAHELGHNLGLWHANSWNSLDSSISPRGTHEEYGNPFDAMAHPGGFPDRQYNANFKWLLGWLTPENVSVISASGTYRLYAQDENSRFPYRQYALNIPAAINADGETEDYWLDFRQLQTAEFPLTATGAILQWGNNEGTPSANRLLDMNFATFDKSDAPLQVSQTFSDPERGLKITPLAKSGADADAYLDVQVEITPPATLSLLEALDNDSLTWITSTPPWTGQTAIAYDGVDAAASGRTPNGGETFLEATVQGPGALYFWWKVSSEETFDVLNFAIDGVDLASISGEVNWHQRACEIGPGPHVARWTYKKDAGTIAGSDRAWVDTVTFVSGDHRPFINSQSLAVTANLNDVAQLHVDAIGSAPITYTWQKLDDNGAPVVIPGQIDATFFLPNAQLSDAGIYSCIVANSSGSVTSTNIILTILHDISLAEALDTTGLAWNASGDAPWSGGQVVTHDGIDAAQAGRLTHAQQSSLNTSLHGPGALSFWWKVSSEAEYDHLSLYRDGELIGRISGEQDWIQKTIIIPNGDHRLRWTYAKDADLSDGEDMAWIDQVQFVPAANLAPVIIVQPAPQSVSIGGAAIFTAQYTATEPATFTWLKNGVPMPGQNSDTLLLINIQSTDADNYSLRIQNAAGIATSLPAALTIVALSLGDAVEQPQRAWLTGGDAPWLPQSITIHDMIDALQSGDITDNQSTWIQTQVTGPATVSFSWKCSTEKNYDFLALEIDTMTALSISGATDWRRETIDLDGGNHVLRWKYQKDRNTDGGDDTCWLDEITITPLASTQPKIVNLTTDANGVSATIESLPSSGQVVVETSPDLKNWFPISTNQITGPAMNLHRPASNSEEFLRARIPAKVF
jgi:hypothetical protein